MVSFVYTAAYLPSVRVWTLTGCVWTYAQEDCG